MYSYSKMNSEINIDNSSSCEQTLSRGLSIIHPDSLDRLNYPSPPGIIKTSPCSSINNMPYDEECCFEDDLFEAGVIEKNLPPIPPMYCSEDDSLEYSSSPVTVLPKKNYDIGDGKFEYVSNKYNRLMLSNAWQAITQTELWDFVAQDIDSFQWSQDSRIGMITNKMEELGYNGHSGGSFGCTMRNMQYLAKNGEKKFIKMFKGADDTVHYEKKDKVNRDKNINEYMGGF